MSASAALTAPFAASEGQRPMDHEPFEAARLTVRLGAIAQNYRIFQSFSAAAEVSGVVKADGYGTGAIEAAKTLRAAGCKTFFVARLSEGIALRPILGDARIFVLDGVQENTISTFVANNLIPVLNSLAQIDMWGAAARASHTTRDAAIHVDTGMNRLGLASDELSVLAGDAKSRLNGIHVALWMSHLACADDSANAMNAVQLSRFRAALSSLPPAPASFASSGGVLLGKDYVFDMVRPGIGLYGGNPAHGKNPFKVVAQMSGAILQLRRVDSGGSVGYGATFRIGRKSVLATVALGYADGLMRSLGNHGFGAIAGHRAPIAGRVSMDLCTLDVTDTPQEFLKAGAEVEFFGDTISLEEAAASGGTANYELLTSLGARLKRVYTGAAQ